MEAFTSQMLAFPPPPLRRILSDRLPVVSPPANFHVTLWGMEKNDGMLKSQVCRGLQENAKEVKIGE